MSKQSMASAVLFTINLRSMAHFYAHVAGMEIINEDADHMVLERNDFRLTVHQIPDQHAKHIVISTPPTVREISAIKLSFPVKSIAKCRAVAAQLGGCVYASEREWSYEGSAICDGWDPDGNVFQLSQWTDC